MRLNFGRTSGVVVDMCREHGTWFDSGELPKILAFLKGGGLQLGGMDPRQYLVTHIHPANNSQMAKAFGGKTLDSSCQTGMDLTGTEAIVDILRGLESVKAWSKTWES